jgi:hypothetical protein
MSVNVPALRTVQRPPSLPGTNGDPIDTVISRNTEKALDAERESRRDRFCQLCGKPAEYVTKLLISLAWMPGQRVSFFGPLTRVRGLSP